LALSIASLQNISCFAIFDYVKIDLKEQIVEMPNRIGCLSILSNNCTSRQSTEKNNV